MTWQKRAEVFFDPDARLCWLVMLALVGDERGLVGAWFLERETW